MTDTTLMPPTRLLLNPGAGSAEDGIESLMEWIDAHEAVRLQSPQGPEATRRLAREAAAAGQRVIAAGGDGTVHTVVQGLMDAAVSDGVQPVLGILPLGTGNDLARSVGLPGDIDDALAVLRRGRLRDLDVIRCDFGRTLYVANAVNGGFGVRVSESTTSELKSLWGALAYLAGGFAAMFEEIEPFHLTLELDGETHTFDDAANLVIANGRYVAGGVCAAPHAESNDGKLDVIVLRRIDGLARADLAAQLLGGDYTQNDAVEWFRGQHLTLTADPALPLSLDGEVERASHATFHVLPAALRIIL